MAAVQRHKSLSVHFYVNLVGTLSWRNGSQEENKEGLSREIQLPKVWCECLGEARSEV